MDDASHATEFLLKNWNQLEPVDQDLVARSIERAWNEMSPLEQKAMLILANSARRQGNPQGEAVEALLRILERFPNQPTTQNQESTRL